MSSLKERIADTLLSRRLLTREQLEQALAEQRQEGGGLQAILTKHGWVSEADLLSAVSQGLGIPPLSLARMRIDPALKRFIPRELAVQYKLIPVSCIGQAMTVAMADPLNVFALDTLTTLTKFSINPVLATAADIRTAIDTYYGVGVEETLQEMAQKAEAGAVQVVEAQEQEEADTSRLLSLTEEAPVVKYTDSLLERGVRLRASDILIEVTEKAMRIRYRVDGVLQEGPAPPRHLHAAIVSRVKVMSELNIAERRMPQDGHLQIRVDDRAIDVRVSVLPAVMGERVVLRVLDKGSVQLDIDRLGFDPEDLERLKASATRPHGMILVTGPTGSGKTTTLYGLLTHVDAPQKNIVTVEDPVEFDLEGINQVSARPAVGLTFSSALRSILRQDPDVIMVGEIRDSETADMAIKSALTGHLVLSTLHTNTAAGSIVRLVNMGLEPFLINASLLVVIGQRLVRKICSRCAQPYAPPKRMAERLGLLDESGKPRQLVRGKGCKACLQSGYAGREVIAEVLQMNPEIRALVLKRAQERQIEAAARRAGMTLLRERGLAKAMQGMTTLEEVFRTTTGEVVG